MPAKSHPAKAGLIAMTLFACMICGSVRAQDENPTTPGAIPNPGSYQGSQELQQRSDEQDQQVRRQQQEQQQQQQQQQQQYGAPRQSGPGRGNGPAARGPAGMTPSQAADFDAASRGGSASERGDYATAYRLLRPAAERGGLLSPYNLALLYERGTGVTRNYGLAMTPFRKSAEQGFAGAMLNLGVMYGLGEGGPPDPVQAYKRFSLAIPRFSAQADSRAQAVHNRTFIAAKMTRAQIVQAETLARTSPVPFIRLPSLEPALKG